MWKYIQTLSKVFNLCNHSNISLFFFICLLSSCGNLTNSNLNSLSKMQERALNKPLKQTYYTINIPTHDGLNLSATLYQPSLSANETAPLIIHTHGFGLSRMKRPIGLYGSLILSGITAKKAWKDKNYWVISYDQRGHGSSEGIINVMDPNKEAKDITSIVNWIEQNLPRVQKKNNDPVIGMLGESYGGMAQLSGGVQDRRIDSIVPMHTAYNLPYALYPNDIPKTGWLTLLMANTNLLNVGKMHPELNNGYKQALKTRTTPQSMAIFLHGKDFKSNCLQKKVRPINALIIQGFNDILFNINHGYETFNCLKQHNNLESNISDYALNFIGTQGGHITPIIQPSLTPAYSVEKNIQCNNQTYNLSDLILSWLEWSLSPKIQSKPNPMSNTACISTDNKLGFYTETLPTPSTVLNIPKTTTSLSDTTVLERLLNPLHFIITSVKKKKNYNTHATNSLFIPLSKTKNNLTRLSGIPYVNLTFDTPNNYHERFLIKNDLGKNNVFIGIGVIKKGTNKPKLINKQLTPVNLHETYRNLNISGVSTVLNKGDELGLMVYLKHYHFMFLGEKNSKSFTINGNITLPLYTIEP